MLPSNKISQNFTNFQIHEDCVAMETELFIHNKEFNISEGLFVLQYCKSIIMLLFYDLY